MPRDLPTEFYKLLKSFHDFVFKLANIHLRSYQLAAAEAILKSVLHNEGETFVIIFPRQSGKNELQSHIESYLMAIYQKDYKEMIKVSPTWKPQSLNAMRRLESTLNKNMVLRTRWKKESGYIYKIGNCRISFFSGQPRSHIVGATANLLLQIDEAQDVLQSKFDKEINPMAASTNATRVFWGTAWTSNTLLAREQKFAEDKSKLDHKQRVFLINADDVSSVVPSYGKFVDNEIAKFGRNHPFVRTQYYSETIDEESGMFPPARRELMKGSHLYTPAPLPDKMYAFLIDVGGQDEAVTAEIDEERIDLINIKRDSTALTVVELDINTTSEMENKPVYRSVYRRLWLGTAHSYLFKNLSALIDLWQPVSLVIDATGIGAGLASFLQANYPSITTPFIFNSATKSKLGWDFLAVIETGRYKDHEPDPRDQAQAEFWLQVKYTLMDIHPGPNKTMAWSVPDGTRDPATGDLIHDDLVISAALCSVLDLEDWGAAVSNVVETFDPVGGLNEAF